MFARQLALAVTLMTVLFLGATSCGGSVRAAVRPTGAGGSGAGSKDCASCERMCEVAGDAQKNAGAVDKCKADCAKKCG